MRKTEFLRELRESLEGEVSASIIQSNVNYYDQYINGETANGRSEEEVIDEIGSPRLIAKTIIDSNENAKDAFKNSSYTGSGSGGTGSNSSYGQGYGNRDESNLPPYFHYIDLNKWYWKVIITVAIIAVLFALFVLIGGIFTLLINLAGPILLIWLIYSVIKNIWKN